GAPGAGVSRGGRRRPPLGRGRGGGSAPLLAHRSPPAWGCGGAPRQIHGGAPMTPPLTIVTGFLGSGKTTLLRALVEGGAGGRHLALVVNEFGQVGLDGAALARAGA